MKKAAARVSAHNTQTSHAITASRSGHELILVAWQIVLPVGLCTLLGTICDVGFGTKPWLTLLGLAIGFLVAVVLVRRQLGDPEAVDKAAQH